MDVIIFSGQSNMQGATGEAGSSAAQNCLEYKFLTDSFVPVQDPVGEDIGEDTFRAPLDGGGSLVPAFCKAYSEKKGPALAIHCAKGSTTIAEWKPGSARYQTLLKKCRQGIAKAREQYEIGKVYFVWLQGESDALIKTSEEAYLSALVELKNALKEDLGIDKFGIIEIGYFSEFARWQNTANRSDDEAIMRAQERAEKEDRDFVFLTDICKRLSLDRAYLNPKESAPHYNNRGMDLIGEEAGKTFANL